MRAVSYNLYNMTDVSADWIGKNVMYIDLFCFFNSTSENYVVSFNGLIFIMCSIFDLIQVVEL